MKRYLLILLLCVLHTLCADAFDTPVEANFTFENACLFEPVSFMDLSEGTPTSWQWDFDNGTGTSTEQDPSFTFSGDGIFTVRLIVSNSCSVDTFSREIFIASNLPTFQDTTVCNNEPVNVHGEVVQLRVPFDTVFTFRDTSMSSQGCDSISVFRIQVEPCGCELTFPNAFTPNEDGVNDKFQPYVECDQIIKDYRMIIYDRWGETVFETFEYRAAWDGMINGRPMPTDVFVYLVQYEIIDGENRQYFKEVSDFTLIR